MTGGVAIHFDSLMRAAEALGYVDDVIYWKAQKAKALEALGPLPIYVLMDESSIYAASPDRDYIFNDASGKFDVAFLIEVWERDKKLETWRRVGEEWTLF